MTSALLTSATLSIFRVTRLRAEFSSAGTTFWVDLFFNNDDNELITIFFEQRIEAERFAAALNNRHSVDTPPTSVYDADHEAKTCVNELFYRDGPDPLELAGSADIHYAHATIKRYLEEAYAHAQRQ